MVHILLRRCSLPLGICHFWNRSPNHDVWIFGSSFSHLPKQRGTLPQNKCVLIILWVILSRSHNESDRLEAPASGIESARKQADWYWTSGTSGVKARGKLTKLGGMGQDHSPKQTVNSKKSTERWVKNSSLEHHGEKVMAPGREMSRKEVVFEESVCQHLNTRL